jgi:hypothetical protein
MSDDEAGAEQGEQQQPQTIYEACFSLYRHNNSPNVHCTQCMEHYMSTEEFDSEWKAAYDQ